MNNTELPYKKYQIWLIFVVWLSLCLGLLSCNIYFFAKSFELGLLFYIVGTYPISFFLFLGFRKSVHYVRHILEFVAVLLYGFLYSNWIVIVILLTGILFIIGLLDPNAKSFNSPYRCCGYYGRYWYGDTCTKQDTASENEITSSETTSSNTTENN